MLEKIKFHQYDLPNELVLSGDSIAIDTETMGLNLMRDRLCVVQLADSNGNCHVVHFPTPNYDAPNLKKILSNPELTTIYHFARFDVAAIYVNLNILPKKIFCTKIASFLARTYTDRHGLRDIVKEFLDINISKEQQTTYWGGETLSEEQIVYAAGDVLYLHKLKKIFIERLNKLNRLSIANACFEFLPSRAILDLSGWNDIDIFAHSIKNN